MLLHFKKKIKKSLCLALWGSGSVQHQLHPRIDKHYTVWITVIFYCSDYRFWRIFYQVVWTCKICDCSWHPILYVSWKNPWKRLQLQIRHLVTWLLTVWGKTTFFWFVCFCLKIFLLKKWLSLAYRVTLSRNTMFMTDMKGMFVIQIYCILLCTADYSNFMYRITIPKVL